MTADAPSMVASLPAHEELSSGSIPIFLFERSCSRKLMAARYVDAVALAHMIKNAQRECEEEIEEPYGNLVDPARIVLLSLF